ncbi:MAG TPA: type I DNA topoisomerase [Syntrophomonadaceae bacterium]|nr:type I DNA topoisomerase [Syntrophomonadaceae bacterium]
MAKVLVIVESPAKARAISKLLGRKYLVKASMGHIRDLPKSQIGVDIERSFEPKYITIRGKGELIKDLKESAKKADQVLLGPDPDREGEAIAWHLGNILDIPPDAPCRIEFHEITKKALEEAVRQPHRINLNRVDAQQARRVLDRLVGYNLSPLLWRKIKRGLSAGRVQSVAVRLICDREDEIKNFKPEEYWTLTARLKAQESLFEANLFRKGGQKVNLANEEDVNKVIEDLKTAEFIVVKINKRDRRRNPLPPFTTSTLQQEASRKLNFPVKKTMLIAQQLYEGLDLGEEGIVGLITYMRTDSTRLSEEAQNSAREYIKNTFGSEYIPEKAPQYKTGRMAQEAHEAIRPTVTERVPGKVKSLLTRDQYRLYKLIWDRFIASQMSPAVFEATTVDIEAGPYLFRATGSVLRFPGFMRVYTETDEEESTLPALVEGEKLVLQELLPKQHFTQPPPRYTEASLVKTLEENGIGRPSTYAPIIATIQSRGYVVKEDKYLYPTELGCIVVDLLKEYFPKIIDTEFTAGMEEKLDQIEEGQTPWQEVVAEFYRPFKQDLEHAESEIGVIEVEDELSEEKCPNCGRNLAIKQGKYGKFLACPGFPECRYTQPYYEDTGIPCPRCGGKIVVRKTRRGKKFYGCINYPECDFTSWDEPSRHLCPECGHFLTYQGRLKKKLTCPICSKTYDENNLPGRAEVK